VRWIQHFDKDPQSYQIRRWQGQQQLYKKIQSNDAFIFFPYDDEINGIIAFLMQLPDQKVKKKGKGNELSEPVPASVKSFGMVINYRQIPPSVTVEAVTRITKLDFQQIQALHLSLDLRN